MPTNLCERYCNVVHFLTHGEVNVRVFNSGPIPVLDEDLWVNYTEGWKAASDFSRRLCGAPVVSQAKMSNPDALLYQDYAALISVKEDMFLVLVHGCTGYNIMFPRPKRKRSLLQTKHLLRISPVDHKEPVQVRYVKIVPTHNGMRIAPCESLCSYCYMQLNHPGDLHHHLWADDHSTQCLVLDRRIRDFPATDATGQAQCPWCATLVCTLGGMRHHLRSGRCAALAPECNTMYIVPTPEGPVPVSSVSSGHEVVAALDSEDEQPPLKKRKQQVRVVEAVDVPVATGYRQAKELMLTLFASIVTGEIPMDRNRADRLFNCTRVMCEHHATSGDDGLEHWVHLCWMEVNKFEPCPLDKWTKDIPLPATAEHKRRQQETRPLLTPPPELPSLLNMKERMEDQLLGLDDMHAQFMTPEPCNYAEPFM